ncbi:MAG: cell division FtsA domain-containing protein [Candidatus Margulisiibacteriota bacterium]
MINQFNNGVLALDIGSGKLAGVVGSFNTDGVNILSAGVNNHPTGFRKGQIIDFDQAYTDLKQTIARICYVSNVSIKYLVINIRTKDIDFNFCNNKVMLPDDIPASQIEQLSPFQKLAEKLNIELLGFVPDALAASSILLKDSEKERSVVLLDCGRAFIHGTFFQDGQCRHMFELPFGGRHITNDIAYGLSVPKREAESIKIKYSKEPEAIEIADTRQFVKEIIQARMTEIFKFVNKEIEHLVSPKETLMIITGGMSKTRGILEIARTLFDVPVFLKYTPVPGCPVSSGTDWENVPIGLLNIAYDNPVIRNKLKGQPRRAILSAPTLSVPLDQILLQKNSEEAVHVRSENIEEPMPKEASADIKPAQRIIDDSVNNASPDISMPVSSFHEKKVSDYNFREPQLSNTSRTPEFITDREPSALANSRFIENEVISPVKITTKSKDNWIGKIKMVFEDIF